jgi:hypothetical protein
MEVPSANEILKWIKFKYVFYHFCQYFPVFMEKLAGTVKRLFWFFLSQKSESHWLASTASLRACARSLRLPLSNSAMTISRMASSRTTQSYYELYTRKLTARLLSIAYWQRIFFFSAKWQTYYFLYPIFIIRHGIPRSIVL